MKMKNLIAGWSMTDSCNLRCMHCYNNSGKKRQSELSTKQAYKVADILIKNKVEAVNFGGGECPLRPDFFEICKYLHAHGIKLSLTTNGLTYKKVLPYLGLFNDIGVSIDFADKNKHDAFRGRNGAFGISLKAIKEFIGNGANVEIVTCLTKMNCGIHELRAIYNLAKKLKVRFWRINRYRPIGRNNKDRLSLNCDDVRIAYSFFSSLTKSDFVMPDPLFSMLGKKVNHCPCGKTSFRVQSSGEVTPCIYLHESGGNILKAPINSISDSDIFKAIRNRNLEGTKCERCAHVKECNGGCAGSAYLSHGTFDQADPLCWLSDEWNVHEKYLCTAYIPIGA